MAIEIRAHYLLCTICRLEGCSETPAGAETTRRIAEAVRSDPWVTIRLTADLDVARFHYRDVYEGGLADAPEFAARQGDFAGRRRDLELFRRLGLRPNTEYPAVELLRLLFTKVRSLEGICSPEECPNARSDALKAVAERNADKYLSLNHCNIMGEDLDGSGPFILLPTRTKEEMQIAKEESAKAILEAERLFIRPHHLLCMICHLGLGDLDEPLAVDNLHELIVKMREDPDIPVTLTEGCCMVCDPCPAYHPEKHLCMWMYSKDQWKDLRVLQKLGLRPGATLPARELITLLFERIPEVRQVCGSDAMNDSSPFWASCGSSVRGGYEKIREGGFFRSTGG